MVSRSDALIRVPRQGSGKPFSEEGTLIGTTGRWVKTGLAAALVSSTFAGTVAPAFAGDRGGAIAAGVIGGAALGALAGSAAAGAYGAPPPPAYYPPPPRYVEPVDVAPPPRCHREYVRVWDSYAGVYVDRPRRVCEGY